MTNRHNHAMVADIAGAAAQLAGSATILVLFIDGTCILHYRHIHTKKPLRYIQHHSLSRIARATPAVAARHSRFTFHASHSYFTFTFTIHVSHSRFISYHELWSATLPRIHFRVVVEARSRQQPAQHCAHDVALLPPLRQRN